MHLKHNPDSELDGMGYPYYPPPGWIPAPPPCETKKGVKHIVGAMYLAIIIMLLALLLVAFLFGGALDSLEDVDAEEDVSGILGSLALIGVLGLVIFICGLATFILFVMGVSEINRGRNEFGPTHAAKVKRAIIYLVLAIVVAIVGFGVSWAILFSGFDFASGETAISDEDMLLSAGLGGGISLLSSVLGNLFIVTLIIELANEGQRKLLWTGFGIAIATSAVSLVMSMYLAGYGTGSGLIESYDSTYSTFISVGLSLVSFIIFLVCYRGVLARLESGELKPTARPQAYSPMSYPPYPPQYMPPPPPPTAPPQG